jgi:hypothetical protein
MPKKPKAKSKTSSKTSEKKPQFSEGSTIKLQIAAAVFIPMLALGRLWESQAIHATMGL